MIFTIYNTSDIYSKYKQMKVRRSKKAKLQKDGTYIVEINTLEELLKLQKEVKSSIIIKNNDIEVYDYYRE